MKKISNLLRRTHGRDVKKMKRTALHATVPYKLHTSSSHCTRKFSAAAKLWSRVYLKRYTLYRREGERRTEQ